LSQQPLHVLFLPKWYPNKLDAFDGNFVENHAHAVKKFAKVSVIFVHSEERENADYEITQTMSNGITEIRVFFKKSSLGISFLNKIQTAFRYFNAQLIAYKQLLKTSGLPDISHIHVLTRSSLLGLYLMAFKQIPYVITEHWSGYLPINGGYKGWLKKRGTELVVKSASGITAVSKQLKKAMLAHQLDGDYHIIPNVVNTELFRPLAKENVIIEILFVGNLLQSPKRIFDIIESMNFLKQQEVAFQLSIYGEGKDEQGCKELIEHLGIEKEVKLKGTLPRKGIAEVMGKADFLILFSEFENQPCVLNEAMACGLPVIAPDIAGIAERLTPDVGIMIPTGDVSAFQQALLEMCKTFKDYKSDWIRERAIDQFSEDVIGKQFINLYQTALKS
jgi:glycosyltransferase involved in cell wall biosynthesis